MLVIMANSKNYYDILGIDKKATKDDVKKAFRKLAQKHHPDKGGEEAKFKDITEAYSILSDDRKRKEYDSYGQSFAGGAGPGGMGAGAGGFDFSNFQGFDRSAMGGIEFDISDLFGGLGDIFGQQGGRGARVKRGRDISIDIEVSFKESILGTKRSVLITKVSTCDVCEGSGAKPGTEMNTCTTCNGKGQIREVRNSMMGQFESVRTCPTCEGSGKIPKEKCVKCSGHGVIRKEEEINITVPAGMDNGEMMRMQGQGEAVKGGVSGDLYIKVHVKPHQIFKKEGANLTMSMPVKLTDALLGTTVMVTTIDDKQLEVKIPVMQQPEETLRIKGKGVKYAEGGSGDLLIRMTATLPRKLSGKAKKAIEDLKAEGL
jgi:molecular chaperone DnaJ